MAAESFNPLRLTAIVLFGVLGVFCRYLLNVLFKDGFKTDTFWSTIIINVIGSGIIGLMQVIAVERKKTSDVIRFGIMVGLLGGFTTFSGYCLDAILLFEGKDSLSVGLGIGYFILSPLLGLGACYGVIVLTRFLVAPPPVV